MTGLTSGSYTVEITDAVGCTASQVYTIVDCPITCLVDGGTLPVYTGECQAITDGTDASITVGAFDFNTSYDQAYFLVSGGTIQEFVTLPAGSATNVVTFVSNYAAGTYEVYACLLYTSPSPRDFG